MSNVNNYFPNGAGDGGFRWGAVPDGAIGWREIATVATDWMQAPCTRTAEQHRPDSGKNQMPAAEP